MKLKKLFKNAGVVVLSAAVLGTGAAVLPFTSEIGISANAAYAEGIPGVYTFGDYSYQLTENNEVIIKFCKTDANVVKIPSTINGKKVIGIGAVNDSLYGNPVKAFFEGSKVGEVVIPDGVKYIGPYCFKDCTSLKKISMPGTISSVGVDAFKNTAWYNNLQNGFVYAGKTLYGYKGKMPSGTELKVKEGTVSITYMAFMDCKGLKSVEFPKSLKNIGNAAFYNCTDLSVVKAASDFELEDYGYDFLSGYNTFGKTKWLSSLPNGPVYLGKTLLFYNGAVPDGKFTIKNGITTISEYAFFGSNLKSITIPNSVKVIGQSAFFGCEKLQSIVIPGSVTKLGSYAFSECNGLKHVTLSKGVKDISESAFYSCEELKNIVIPDSLTKINGWAFYGCNALTSVVIPCSVKEIGEGAFYSCDYLKTIYGVKNSDDCQIRIKNDRII